jgi:hypothetical protein
VTPHLDPLDSGRVRRAYIDHFARVPCSAAYISPSTPCEPLDQVCERRGARLAGRTRMFGEIRTYRSSRYLSQGLLETWCVQLTRQVSASRSESASCVGCPSEDGTCIAEAMWPGCQDHRPSIRDLRAIHDALTSPPRSRERVRYRLHVDVLRRRADLAR